jgi:hypothetical protein
MVITLQLLPLKAAHHKQFPANVWAGPGVPPSTLILGCAFDVPSFISEGADSFTMSWHSYFESWWKTTLLSSWSPICEIVQGPDIMSSYFPDIASVSGLGPLCHWCL